MAPEPPNLKADLDVMRRVGKFWPQLGLTAKVIGDDASKLTINGRNPFLNDYFNAYNKLCDSFKNRMHQGEVAMSNIGHTVTNIANTFEVADAPS